MRDATPEREEECRNLSPRTLLQSNSLGSLITEEVGRYVVAVSVVTVVVRTMIYLSGTKAGAQNLTKQVLASYRLNFVCERDKWLGIQTTKCNSD
jgi:hypothetical protein